MPLPAILGAAGSVLAAAMLADDVFNGGVVQAAIGKRAAQAVLDARGIPLNLDGEVTRETITQAINAAVMPEGVTFENLFDSEAVKRDVRRIAIEKAGQAFGFDGVATAQGLKDKVFALVVAEVQSDIAAGGGDYLDAARSLVKEQRLIDLPPPKDWQAPRKFTQKAVKNRERQARFRASSKRVWIEK